MVTRRHILVTGVSGFSGAAIARALIAAGHRVTGLVGTSQRKPRGLVAQRDVLDLVQGDLSTELPLPAKVDAIVHTAARSAWTGISADAMVRDNVLATRQLINYARECEIGRFIFFSTMSVYGTISAQRVDETTPTVNPDVYGLSKLLCEAMLDECADSFQSLSLRLPGVVGPGSVRNWLTTTMEAVREGKDITVFNPDTPFNNAVHIADLGQFVCRLMEQNWKGADVVTLAAEGTCTVGDVVMELIRCFRSKSIIRYQASERAGFTISNERARYHYGFSSMPISEIVRRFAGENIVADAISPT